MAFTNPSVAEFKSFFSRDFPFAPVDDQDPDKYVLDSDITKAFTFSNMNINQGLFSDQGSFNIGYNLLSAHYLTMNLRASSQGINGQFAFLENSKGVGSVNTAFSIPQRVLDNPDWSILCKTNYGAQYIQIVLPQLCGQMYTVPGNGIVPGVGNGTTGWGFL